MPTASKSVSGSRLLELDGLRGFAVLIVVLLHYFHRVMAPATPAYKHFQVIFRLGWTGVDLFFILSGFLIGGILLDARSSPTYFRTFYIRRFFRIIPIYYLWILTYIAIAVFGGRLVTQYSNSHHALPLDFSVFEHFFFLQNIVVPNAERLFLYWFGVLWSLAVEEQFYLVAPLLIRVLNRRTLYCFVIALIAVAPLLRVYFRIVNPGLHVDVYSFTLCRADALSFGILAALLWREQRFRDWIGRSSSIVYLALALLAGGMLVLWYKFSDPKETFALTVGLSWIALFYFVLLLVVLAYRESLLARWARASWLRELGRVSYCVYVIHFGISFLVFGLIFHKIPYLSDLPSLFVTILTAIGVYFIARLSWNYLEGPLVDLGHRFTYLPVSGSSGKYLSSGSTRSATGV